MVLMDAFLTGDVYLDFPYESAKFRFEHDTRKVYRRFYGEAEDEIPQSSKLYTEAICAGEQISREEYFRD